MPSRHFARHQSQATGDVRSRCQGVGAHRQANADEIYRSVGHCRRVIGQVELACRLPLQSSERCCVYIRSQQSPGRHGWPELGCHASKMNTVERSELRVDAPPPTPGHEGQEAGRDVEKGATTRNQGAQYLTLITERRQHLAQADPKIFGQMSLSKRPRTLLLSRASPFWTVFSSYGSSSPWPWVSFWATLSPRRALPSNEASWSVSASLSVWSPLAGRRYHYPSVDADYGEKLSVYWS